MRTLVGPQDVARVAVAVQANGSYSPPLATGIDEPERLLDGFPGVEKVRRNEVVLEQVGARVVAEGLHRQAFPVVKLLVAPTAWIGKAADPFKRLGLAELGRAPAAAGIDGINKTGKACLVSGSNHRYLPLGELANACSSSICASVQRPGR